MKYIGKSKPPAKLTQWLRRQKGFNCRYKPDMPGDVKGALQEKLLDGQGRICGYTGIRITMDTSHIEHTYPQTMCEKEDPLPELFGARRDVDYYNVIAAFPKSDLEHRDSYPFGAKTRGDWYDSTLFIHPLMRDCETKFRYTLEGVIEPKDDDSEGPAATTIRELNLDDRRLDEAGRFVDRGPLTELRRKAIETLLFDQNEPLSRTQIERILTNIYRRNSDGSFVEFCFVLRQACEELIRKAERERVRREAIQKQERHKQQRGNR